LTGRWSIYWGERGENEVILEPFDVVSVPVGVNRGFRNVSEGEQVLLAVIGGDDAGKVTWPRDMEKRVEQVGYRRDRAGNIVRTAAAE